MLISLRGIHEKMNNFWLGVLVITTLIGPLVYLGFASLYHFVVLALLLMVLYKGVNTAQFKTEIMLFLVLWLAEAVISVVWAPNKTMALQYVYYIFLIFSICILFHCYLSKDNLTAFSQFMVVVLFICNLIAVWEMYSGNHLVEGYLSDPVRLRLLMFVPGGFYFNPNDFATFIIQALPFSLMCISSKKIPIRIMAIGNFILSIVTVCATQSRTQMIIISMMYVFFILVFNKKALLKYGTVLTVVAIVLYFVYSGFRDVINAAIESLSEGSILSSATTTGASLNIRLNLLKNAAIILYDTLGFGIGAGCHRAVMEAYSSQYYNTSDIVIVHNLAAEIFVDYGVIVGIVFLIAIYRSCFQLIRIYKKNTDSDVRLLAIMLAFSLGIFIFCGVSSSSILQISSLWVTFCFASQFIKLYRA